MLDRCCKEHETLSLKLLAIMMYDGDFRGLSCENCQSKEELNCDMDTTREDQVYYFDPLNISINTCPINCILPEHVDFSDRFMYNTQTGTMPRYEDCPAWYWRLHKEFAGYKSVLEAKHGN